MKRTLFTAGILLISVFSLPFLFYGCDESECMHTRMVKSTVAPTCDREGYTLNVCEDCQFQYKTDILPPNGHTLTESVTAPTCLSEGFTAFSCTCGYTYRGNVLPPSGHQYQSTTIEPTCEQEGYTEHTCTVCSHSYRSEISSALGHRFASNTIEPTCTEKGYTVHVCLQGDLTYYSDEQAPLGHHMVTSAAIMPTSAQSGRLTQHCTECSHQFTDYLLYSDVFADAYVSNRTPLAKGVDISYHNHKPTKNGYQPLNWRAIRNAGFDFAILRAGYSGTKDAVFEMNYADARAAGMDLGVYYYTYATTVEEAKAEAEELIGWLANKQFEYPIYYDMEESRLTSVEKDTLTEMCLVFVDTLRRAGYYGAVYSNNSFLNDHLNADELKSYGEIWYARYQKDPSQPSDDFSIEADDNDFVWLDTYGKQLGLWQYTQHGVISDSNISQKVDMNYAFKDYPTLMKKFCLNGFTPEAET